MWEWSYQYFIMIEELKYFFLGIIQGLTEFFPISSSGHIELYSDLFSVSKETVIITGASGQLGLVYQKAFLREGSNVVGIDIYKSQEIDDLKSEYKTIF